MGVCVAPDFATTTTAGQIWILIASLEASRVASSSLLPSTKRAGRISPTGQWYNNVGFTPSYTYCLASSLSSSVLCSRGSVMKSYHFQVPRLPYRLLCKSSSIVLHRRTTAWDTHEGFFARMLLSLNVWSAGTMKINILILTSPSICLFFIHIRRLLI